MNKKLMALAVAAAMAPGFALAQSSVTISGVFKVGPDHINYSGATSITTTPADVAAGRNPSATMVNRTSNSEGRITDHSSRIIFNVTEDLGGGLQAIGQIDVRFNPSDIAYAAGHGFPGVMGGGNTWVGLRSKTWGTLTFGRHDLHYGKAGDDTAAYAGSLQMIASGMFDYVGRPQIQTANSPAVGTNTSIAGTTRTNNVVRWDSPSWGILSGTFAMSTNPLQTSGGNSMEGDLHTGNVNNTVGTGLAGTGANAGLIVRRRGIGWNFNPKLTGSNWFAEWSHWRAKQDTNLQQTLQAAVPTLQGGAAAWTNAPVQHDQVSNVLAGHMRFGGFKLGLAWNQSVTKDPASGLRSAKRSAWSIPITYAWGKHHLAGHWTKANDSEGVQIAYATVAAATAASTAAALPGTGTAFNPASGQNTGAHMFAITYSYLLSKRTSVGLGFAQLQNKSNAAYAMFYNSQTAFGSASAGSLAGEDSRLFSAAVRHAF